MISIKVFFNNRKYFASAFLFSCFSLIFSTWVTYIPYIADKLKLGEGKIGQAIFFMGLGAFFMIRISRHLVDKVGVGKYTYYSLVAYSICFFGPFLSNNYISLCISLFILGMAASSFTISLNSLTATIEMQDGIYIMTGSHGFWSIGGMIGSASGSFIAAQVSHPIIHVAILVTLILIIQTSLKSNYYYRTGKQEQIEKLGLKKVKPLLIIAIVGLIFMVSEGAIADWSALYLKKIIQLDLQYIGFGYSAFSLAMMIGRFSGDALSQKLGSWKLITCFSLLSIIGFLLVLVYNPIVSIFGFFVVGTGFSVIVPEIFRLASKVERIKTADGVAFIAATTNIGFLVGPVLLGFVAELKSLHLSFIVLTIFISQSFFISLLKLKRSK